MSIHIYLSNNSIRNTTLSCDSLGIHYTVSHTDGITSVTRWNGETDTNELVGEFELPFFKKDRVRLGEDGEWRLARTFLIKDEGAFISTARSFEANNGVHYRWKAIWGHLIMTHDSEREYNKALITYHRNQFSKDPAYLEVGDSSVLGGLGYIISAYQFCVTPVDATQVYLTILKVSFLIMEKKRRDRQKYRQHGASGGP